MECPGNHEWYELARGTATRDDVERLRHHLGECRGCKPRADEIGEVGASLERLAGRTRVDLSDGGKESLYRRAKGRGLLGRPRKRSWLLRLWAPHSRLRHLRYGIPAAAAAAIVIIALAMRPPAPTVVEPRGALGKLVQGAAKAGRGEDLQALIPLARAAVAEELAQPKPRLSQVGDLALVTYITERVCSDRQIEDVRFLLAGVKQKRGAEAPPPVASVGVGPMLATVNASPGDLPVRGGQAGGGSGDPLAAAKAHVLRGEYRRALDVMPSGPSARVLRAWCLEAVNRAAEASVELGQDDLGRDDAAFARILRADLALRDGNVARAIHEYDTLAGTDDRFWFGSGYLCLYELDDRRGAGQRFAYVKDPRLAGYVAGAFETELEAARCGPGPMVSEDFESYAVGPPPTTWRLERTRGGEFTIVAIPGGKALQADELDAPGSELLTGLSEWSDYTLQMDIKVIETDEDYMVGAAVCRHASDPTGYLLELTPSRLRLLKQFPGVDKKAEGGKAVRRMVIEPPLAQVYLPESPVVGWWYTLKIRVQRVDATSVSLAGKFWRTDVEEPISWQVTWTDPGQGAFGPHGRGFAGFQVRGAKILVDNLIVTRNKLPQASSTALRKR